MCGREDAEHHSNMSTDSAVTCFVVIYIGKYCDEDKVINLLIQKEFFWIFLKFFHITILVFNTAYTWNA